MLLFSLIGLFEERDGCRLDSGIHIADFLSSSGAGVAAVGLQVMSEERALNQLIRDQTLDSAAEALIENSREISPILARKTLLTIMLLAGKMKRRDRTGGVATT